MCFGLLSSVAANASAFASGGFTVASSTAGTNGWCSNSASSRTSNVVYNSVNAATTANVITLTAGTATDVTSGHTAKVSITSGPAIITTASAAAGAGSTTNAAKTLAVDGSSLTFTGDNTNLSATNVSVKLTGLGTVKVATSYDGVVIDIFTINTLASCSTGYNSGKSSVSLQAAGAGAASSQDTSDAAGANVVAYNSSAVIRLYLADAYGNTLSDTNHYLSATATGGAGVDFGGSTSATTASAVLTSGLYNAKLTVNNGGVTTPVVTTVSISLDGNVIGTKSITFTGQAAKIVVSDVSNYIAASGTDTVKVKVLDAAGNQLAGWTPVAGDSALNVNGASFGSFNASSATATVNATLTAGATEGDSASTLRIKLDDGSYVVSDVIKFKTTSASIDTFTTALDKASYAPGEVVTLTITGKNSKGNLVADTTTLGGTVSWVGSGLTAVTANPAAADTPTDGVWTYKFYASTTEGNYGYSIKTTSAGTTTSAQTGTFGVKVVSSGVTNAEVLAAIVKLIASINKQIAALQKALMKK